MSTDILAHLAQHVTLIRHKTTGLACVVDGTHGIRWSCHPSIHHTGSVRGMKHLGYWQQKDRTIRAFGFIYNVDSLLINDSPDHYDDIAAQNCLCLGCRERNTRTTTHRETEDTVYLPFIDRILFTMDQLAQALDDASGVVEAGEDEAYAYQHALDRYTQLKEDLYQAIKKEQE